MQSPEQFLGMLIAQSHQMEINGSLPPKKNKRVDKNVRSSILVEIFDIWGVASYLNNKSHGLTFGGQVGVKVLDTFTWLHIDADTTVL